MQAFLNIKNVYEEKVILVATKKRNEEEKGEKKRKALEAICIRSFCINPITSKNFLERCFSSSSLTDKKKTNK